METRLYIGNMSQELTGDDLRAMFSEAGTVEAVDVVIDRKSGRSRGFAFVTMTSQEEAEKAIAMFNTKEVNGRALKVNITLPREERPGASTSPNQL
jgi:RNA recognition motif-containing protein